MSDEYRGLYQKYQVRRTDGSSEPGGKHEDCQYFVLDMDHDPHAVAALEAYMNSCRTAGHIRLSEDLRIWVTGRKSGIIKLQAD